MSSADDTDELVRRAQAGSSAAYDALFGRVSRRLLLYVRLRMGAELRGKLDPMDVVQETYVEAHKSFARFAPRGAGSFARWIYRVADHRIHDMADRFGAAKRSPSGGILHESEVLRQLRAAEESPSTAFARREARERLSSALARLSEAEREALLLRYFHGLTLVEIAEQLACSEATVRRLVARGCAELGALLRAAEG
ncbi:MAG: sigma-70 family RNA polymerase sigma factor [Planctomycetota bacterium]|nr:MAG: sigma-70 family RNA polymerase sigma factor [Planctomycetota bacterium]